MPRTKKKPPKPACTMRCGLHFNHLVLASDVGSLDLGVLIWDRGEMTGQCEFDDVWATQRAQCQREPMGVNARGWRCSKPATSHVPRGDNDDVVLLCGRHAVVWNRAHYEFVQTTSCTMHRAIECLGERAYPGLPRGSEK